MIQMPKHSRRAGFTIVELLVVVSIIALLIAILLPAIGKARDAARVTQSQGNMRNLMVANDTYSADWADRQWTACPDDAGIVVNGQGQGAQYGTQIGCMGQQLVGYDSGGALWGWWCGGPLCVSGAAGDTGYWNGCFDYCFVPHSPTSPYFGAFRLPCVKSFNSYIGDRWYDPILWAPKDVIPLRIAEPFFDYPGEFTPYDPSNSSSQIIAYPSYVWSPAAMWSPEVSSQCGFREPFSNDLVGAFRSPAVGQCKFPDLKSRMMEHHWLQNNESESNPSFAGNDPSWIMTQGYNSQPVTGFFDGHVAVKGIREAMDADGRAQSIFEANNSCSLECNGGTGGGCESGLWNRAMATRFGHGQNGYGGNLSYDTLVRSGAHMFTTNGIRGKDFTNSEG